MVFEERKTYYLLPITFARAIQLTTENYLIYYPVLELCGSEGVAHQPGDGRAAAAHRGTGG